MIWHPLVGMRVRLRYNRNLRAQMEGLHGAVGVIERVAIGPGPINAEVLLDNGRRVVVPRGQLFRMVRVIE